MRSTLQLESTECFNSFKPHELSPKSLHDSAELTGTHNVSHVMPIAGCHAVSSSIIESPCMLKTSPRLSYHSTAP